MLKTWKKKDPIAGTFTKEMDIYTSSELCIENHKRGN